MERNFVRCARQYYPRAPQASQGHFRKSLENGSKKPSLVREEGGVLRITPGEMASSGSIRLPLDDELLFTFPPQLGKREWMGNYVVTSL